jgi:drug/metabolite transporter (DMT)-like permease
MDNLFFHQMRKKAFIALALAVLFWGTTYPTIKYGLTGLHLPPILFMCLRFIVATAAAVPLLSIKKVRNEVSRCILQPDIIILGVLNGLAYTFQFIGLKTTQAGVASIIFNTYVLFASIFIRFIFREPIGKRKLLAILSGFLGAAVISLGDVFSSTRQDGTLSGTVLIILCSVVTGLYVALSGKVMRVKDGPRAMSPLSVYLASTVYTLILLLIEAAVSRDLQHMATLNLGSMLWIGYLGIFCTFFAFILYLYGVRVFGAINTSIFLLAQVFISIVISVLLLNETIDLFTITGAPFIFVAIWLIGRVHRSSKANN